MAVGRSSTIETAFLPSTVSIPAVHRHWIIAAAVLLLVTGAVMVGVSLSLPALFDRGWPTAASPDWLSPALVVIGGILCVLAVAALREWLTPGFRSVGEATALLHLPVVAMTPDIGGADRVGDAASRREAADSIVIGRGTAVERRITALIATLIARYGRAGRCSIAVCSALPGEGKTTFTICLARAAAQAGLQVALIDCDGRRAMLSKAMRGTSAAGLVQVLQDGAAIDTAFERDSIPGIAMLRHSSDDRTQPLSDPHLIARLFAVIGDRFDLVLLDTGPVLALAEATALASAADTVLLVSRWRRTPRNATLIAVRMLRRAKASVAGVVLTRVRGQHR